MCGIAGWMLRGASQGVDRDTLIRMRDAMEHRGPAGSL